MDFAAIPSQQPKSASVKGSSALDIADHDPTDVRLDNEGVDIAGSSRLTMPLGGVTTDVNPTAVMVDKTEIQKEKNNEAKITFSGPDRLAEVVTCRLPTGKQTGMDDSATPEQLDWTAETLQQAQQEDMEIKDICACLAAARESPRLEDATPLSGANLLAAMTGTTVT